MFWNKVLIDLLGDSRLRINEDVYDVSEIFQNVLNNTTDKPSKKLNDIDKVHVENISKSLNYEVYIRNQDKLNQVDIDILRINLKFMLIEFLK